MKILYFGGQKSGKSTLAEARALALCENTPCHYVATYDHSYGDEEMQKRLDKHRLARRDSFVTVEEPRDLAAVIRPGGTYLIDCVSMWLLNALQEEEEILLAELEAVCGIDANIVFVLNDVSGGVIPMDPISRRYVDLSGLVGQKLASLCDEVVEVKLGLERRLK